MPGELVNRVSSSLWVWGSGFPRALQGGIREAEQLGGCPLGCCLLSASSCPSCWTFRGSPVFPSRGLPRVSLMSSSGPGPRSGVSLRKLGSPDVDFWCSFGDACSHRGKALTPTALFGSPQKCPVDWERFSYSPKDKSILNKLGRVVLWNKLRFILVQTYFSYTNPK